MLVIATTLPVSFSLPMLVCTTPLPTLLTVEQGRVVAP